MTTLGQSPLASTVKNSRRTLTPGRGGTRKSFKCIYVYLTDNFLQARLYLAHLFSACFFHRAKLTAEKKHISKHFPRKEAVLHMK